MRPSILLSGCLAAALFVVPAAAQADKAREAVAQHAKELEAKQAAIAQGLFNEADARDAAARAALQRAREAYEAAGPPKRGSIELLTEYALVAQQLGYFDLASEAMETAVAQAPDNARAWALLGMSAIERGPKHERRGLEALHKSLALDASSKDTAAPRVALAKLYMAQGLPAFAQDALDQALAVDPANPEATVRRAALQARAGKIREANDAIDALGKAAQPFDPLTRVLLREALDTFERDGGFFEDQAENHVAFARLLYRAGRVPEAVLAAGRAVTLKPDDLKTLNFIGSMHTQMGNADAARQAYEKSLALDPNQPAVTETLKQLPPPGQAPTAP